MQKAWNIGSAIIIIGLGVWVFFLIRANMHWAEFIQYTHKAIAPATPDGTTPVADNITPQTISGGDIWSQFQDKVKEMTIDLKFDKQQ